MTSERLSNNWVDIFNPHPHGYLAMTEFVQRLRYFQERNGLDALVTSPPRKQRWRLTLLDVTRTTVRLPRGRIFRKIDFKERPTNIKLFYGRNNLFSLAGSTTTVEGDIASLLTWYQNRSSPVLSKETEVIRTLSVRHQPALLSSQDPSGNGQPIERRTNRPSSILRRLRRYQDRRGHLRWIQDKPFSRLVYFKIEVS